MREGQAGRVGHGGVPCNSRAWHGAEYDHLHSIDQCMREEQATSVGRGDVPCNAAACGAQPNHLQRRDQCSQARPAAQVGREKVPWYGLDQCIREGHASCLGHGDVPCNAAAQ